MSKSNESTFYPKLFLFKIKQNKKDKKFLEKNKIRKPGTLGSFFTKKIIKLKYGLNGLNAEIKD